MLPGKRSRYIAVASLLPLSGLCYWLLHWWNRRQKGVGNGAATEETDSSSSAGTTTSSASSDCELEENERPKYHEMLMQMKARGNEFFQEGQYEAALEAYQNCIDACSALGSHDAVAVEVDHVVRVNVILVFLKLKRPEEARMLATFLLQDEACPVRGELKVKALYRRGLASQDIGDLESALCDFRAAVECSPGQSNPAAERAIAGLMKGSS
ncbi:hypothetical protein, conserved [Trypanosoma brucei gambiense DAL972]|uniref:Uncharacterized protein n=2 Tax=Trypanosoma brucei TaxID=5691 RepID=D0AAM1_TRYB9|nr:hypothetical protein, conserved [Trypanosoma brucei gambiense DAL972]RHW68373.1 TPR repeat [Trypanosoma brucei equiperdum]CBH18722.1 hypothetical protein, conserved [Trypanosoma brucei gambiense DAL972]|eukprot:XP_011780986.1 hypothetical protein, conserved [Trypanosoma brucei gambiense DAL972]